MKDIIAPVPKELLKAELTADRLLRRTSRGDNEIYVVTANEAPNVMREIGRLREIAEKDFLNISLYAELSKLRIRSINFTIRVLLTNKNWIIILNASKVNNGQCRC